MTGPFYKSGKLGEILKFIIGNKQVPQIIQYKIKVKLLKNK